MVHEVAAAVVLLVVGVGADGMRQLLARGRERGAFDGIGGAPRATAASAASNAVATVRSAARTVSDVGSVQLASWPKNTDGTGAIRSRSFRPRMTPHRSAASRSVAASASSAARAPEDMRGEDRTSGLT